MLLELRRHPYRILFPLGWLLCWAGLLPWVFAWALPELGAPRELHALVLVQGALTSFAAGFLFTMLPRRLEGPPPGVLLLALAVVVPPLHLLLLGLGAPLLGQLAWLALALGILAFVFRLVALDTGARTGPAAFLWVPVAWSFGCAGSALWTITELEWVEPRLGSLGWLLLTQGLFLCLVLGVGALFLPLAANKETCADACDLPAPVARRLAHGAAALGLLLGFWLEARGSYSLGRGLRAVVALAVLVAAARIHRLPRVPGTQRKLIWLASWCLPVGLALAALLPTTPHVGLHLFLLGGVGLLTLSVGLHVGLAHGGAPELLDRPVGAVRLFGGLLLAGLALRLAAEWLPTGRLATLALAAGLALLSLVPWGLLVVPRLLVGLIGTEAPGDLGESA